MTSKQFTVEPFDSPRSDNGDISDLKLDSQLTKGIRERIQFYEKDRSFKDGVKERKVQELPSRIDMIKQRLLKRAAGEEDDNILSGDCEDSFSDDENQCVGDMKVELVSSKKESELNRKMNEMMQRDLNERFLKSREQEKKDSDGKLMDKLSHELSGNLNIKPESVKILSDKSNIKSESKSNDQSQDKLNPELSSNLNVNPESNDKALDMLSPRLSGNLKFNYESKDTLNPELSDESSTIKPNAMLLDELSPKVSGDLKFNSESKDMLSPEVSDNLKIDPKSNKILLDMLNPKVSGNSNIEPESNDSPVLNYSEIELTNIKNNLKKTILPTTQELLDDFSTFSFRPTFLNVKLNEIAVASINTMNIYNGKHVAFSKADFLSKEFLFRSPGQVLTARPVLTVLNSILSESKRLYYIKVSTDTSHWIVLKEDFGSEQLMSSDLALSQFILTDVVTEVYKRSSYLIYDHRIVVGKFIGTSLCLCVGIACLRSLPCRAVEKVSRTKMLIDGIELELSCESERNEWIETIRKIQVNN